MNYFLTNNMEGIFMRKEMFYKVICETVNVFEKTILVDENCKNLPEVYKILTSYSELQNENVTWIVYPMSVVL